MRTVGCISTFTRGFGIVGFAWPACVQVTVDMVVTRYPGTALSYVTVNPPLLISTIGPTSVIEA